MPMPRDPKTSKKMFKDLEQRRLAKARRAAVEMVAHRQSLFRSVEFWGGREGSDEGQEGSTEGLEGSEEEVSTRLSVHSFSNKTRHRQSS